MQALTTKAINNRSLLRKSSALMVIRGSSLLLPYILEIILSRKLGSMSYGLYTYNISWIILIAFVLQFGFSTSSRRYVPQYAASDISRLKGFINIAFLWPFLLGIIGILIYFICARYAFSDSIKHDVFLIALLATPFLAANQILEGVFISLGNPFLASFLTGFVRPIVFIFLILGSYYFFDFYVYECTVLFSLAAFFSWAVSVFFLLKKIRKKYTGEAIYNTGTWLHVSFVMFSFSLFNMLTLKSDTLMVGYLIGTNHVGFYNAAVKTASLVAFPIAICNLLVTPLISLNFHEKKIKELQDVLTRYAIVTSLVSVIAIILIAIVGESLLELFGLYNEVSYRCLLILAFGNLINALAGPVGYLCVLTGFQYNAMLFSAISAAINILLNFLLIPIYGILGAATATLISFILWNGILLLFVRKKVGVNSGLLALCVFICQKKIKKGV